MTTRIRRLTLIPLLLLALGLALAACGGDGDDGDATATPAATPAPTEAATEAPTEAATPEAEPATEAPAEAGSADERYLRALCAAGTDLQIAFVEALIELETGGGEDDATVFTEPLTAFAEALREATPPDDVADYHGAIADQVEAFIATLDALDGDSLADPLDLVAGLFESADATALPTGALDRLLATASTVPECEEAAFILIFLDSSMMAAAPDDSGGWTSVTVMLDWTPNTNHAGIYVAHAMGWYEENGIEVEIVQPGEVFADQAVAAGVAEFGISVQEAVIPAREQGIPVVAIAAIIEHNTSSLIALGGEGIERPRDLAGKTYGGWGGALETALISALVECDGGDPSAVEYAIIGNVDYLVGMQEDHYDFVWIFDGWDGIRYTEVLGEDVSFLSFIEYTDCIPDWYTPVIITSEELIADDPWLVADFMEATARGYRYAIAYPDEAATILLDAAPELDEALVRASAAYLAGRYTSDPDNWGRQELEVWTRFELFLREAGLTESAIDVEAAFTNDFLP